MLDKVVRILQEYKKKVQAEQEELAELGEGFKDDDFIFKTKYNHPITSEYLKSRVRANVSGLSLTTSC